MESLYKARVFAPETAMLSAALQADGCLLRYSMDVFDLYKCAIGRMFLPTTGIVDYKAKPQSFPFYSANRSWFFYAAERMEKRWIMT